VDTNALDTSDDTVPPRPLRIWTLTKGARQILRDAHVVTLGIELVVTVDDDVRRTEVARTPVAEKALAGEWRYASFAKGWERA